MKWLEEILDQHNELLSGDLKMVYDFCGKDVLIRLCEHLMGLNIYISAKSIIMLKKVYVKMHYNGHNVKELANKVGCSERFIYDILKEGKCGDKG
ncbi:MAG: hypothetical protein M0Z75_10050 [Nitrospiraceae bacterium]|nr:hypothetical protein [Nitrospiraceae bacterium]